MREIVLIVKKLQQNPFGLFYQKGAFQLPLSPSIFLFQPESITILVDSAQRADDLDEVKILKAKEEAEKLLSDKKDQKDFAEASSQLTQSLSQLRAIEALKKNIKRKK